MKTRNQAQDEQKKKKDKEQQERQKRLFRSRKVIGRNDIILDASRKKIKFEVAEEDSIVVKEEDKITEPLTSPDEQDLSEAEIEAEVKEEVDIPNDFSSQQIDEPENTVCGDGEASIISDPKVKAIEEGGSREDGNDEKSPTVANTNNICPNYSVQTKMKTLNGPSKELNEENRMSKFQLGGVQSENQHLKAKDIQVKETTENEKINRSANGIVSDDDDVIGQSKNTVEPNRILGSDMTDDLEESIKAKHKQLAQYETQISDLKKEVKLKDIQNNILTEKYETTKEGKDAVIEKLNEQLKQKDLKIKELDEMIKILKDSQICSRDGDKTTPSKDVCVSDPSLPPGRSDSNGENHIHRVSPRDTSISTDRETVRSAALLAKVSGANLTSKTNRRGNSQDNSKRSKQKGRQCMAPAYSENSTLIFLNIPNVPVRNRYGFTQKKNTNGESNRNEMKPFGELKRLEPCHKKLAGSKQTTNGKLSNVCLSVERGDSFISSNILNTPIESANTFSNSRTSPEDHLQMEVDVVEEYPTQLIEVEAEQEAAGAETSGDKDSEEEISPTANSSIPTRPLSTKGNSKRSSKRRRLPLSTSQKHVHLAKKPGSSCRQLGNRSRSMQLPRGSLSTQSIYVDDGPVGRAADVAVGENMNEESDHSTREPVKNLELRPETRRTKLPDSHQRHKSPRFGTKTRGMGSNTTGRHAQSLAARAQVQNEKKTSSYKSMTKKQEASKRFSRRRTPSSSLQEQGRLSEGQTSANRLIGIRKGENKKMVHKCDVCGKVWLKPSELICHMRTHTGEKPFECDICHEKFTKSSNLKRHRRIHTGEKPFECTICNKRFTHAPSLQYHLLVHSGKRPFKCELCKSAFFRIGDLNTHKNKHSH